MSKEKTRIVDMPGVYLKDDENVIDYKIVKLEEDGVTKLFLCAIGEMWTDHIKNTVLMKITDTGDGIKIGKKYMAELVNEDGEIEYHNEEYLRILLNYNESLSSKPAKYKILQESIEL